ncbi:MAG TPA: hypothetical protein ENH91_10385 [Leeuwenhoekiella sp.]|nr:hypothetical protein [Leeuwenhoekiella sp.]
MNTEELKKAISQELKNCDNKNLLFDILLKFHPNSKLEGTENYVSESRDVYALKNDFQLPDWKFKEIQEDRKKLKRGELQLLDWEDVEVNIKQQYGL